MDGVLIDGLQIDEVPFDPDENDIRVVKLPDTILNALLQALNFDHNLHADGELTVIGPKKIDRFSDVLVLPRW